MLKKTVGAELQSLPEVFWGRLFTIPDYQRGYAWDEKQVSEMLVDINHLLDDHMSRRHYTGTLVFGRADENSEELHVVDGQQRLTTLVILMGLLGAVLPENERAGFRELYVRRGTPGSDRFVLRLSSDCRQFFEQVILGDGDPHNYPIELESQRRLLHARNLIGQWLDARLAASTTTTQLRKAVEEELGFLVYAPKEDSETGIMFEVINNRGKPLSELEKVKNYLIYVCAKLSANTLRADIDTSWSSILRYLSIAGKTNAADEGAFLRYAMVVHFELNKTDSQYGYDELKKRVHLDDALKSDEGRAKVITLIAQFVRFLQAAALWYARLYGRQHEQLGADLVRVFDQIRAQDRHASIMPLFLALVIKHNGKGDRLTELLTLLEILNFRVYMARNITQRNDSGQGELFDYAAQYYHGGLLLEAIKDAVPLGIASLQSDDQALEFRLVQFALWYARDMKFAQSLQLEARSNDDFYAWRGLRYFLMNYEQHLQPSRTIQIDKITMSRGDGKSADYLSVEHLWAREYRNAPGENDRPVDNIERRRLGNFVLLELRFNIQGGNMWIDDKAKHYLGTEAPAATELVHVRDVAQKARKIVREHDAEYRSKKYFLAIHRKINDYQEARFQKFALERWSLAGYLGYKQVSKSLAESEED